MGWGMAYFFKNSKIKIVVVIKWKGDLGENKVKKRVTNGKYPEIEGGGH